MESAEVPLTPIAQDCDLLTKQGFVCSPSSGANQLTNAHACNAMQCKLAPLQVSATILAWIVGTTSGQLLLRGMQSNSCPKCK